MKDSRVPMSAGGRRWRLPDAKTYVEVAGKLLVWAVKSKSAQARAQFGLLANLYEGLVQRAATAAKRPARARKGRLSRKPERVLRPRTARSGRLEAPAPQSQ